MGNDTKRRLATAAVLLTVATAGSRVLGLVREMVMLYFLGLGPGMGAFTVAFKVPSLVRTLLADTALSAAFIPVFSGLLEKKMEREAWQVAYTVTVLATGALGLVSVLGMVFSPEITGLVAPGYRDPATIGLSTHLMRIMFPSVVVLGLAGIFMGILNAYDHFTLPALAPIVWNIVIIVTTALLAPRWGFNALAWGIMAGTVVELLIQVPAVCRRRWRGPQTAWRLVLRSPALRQVGVLLGPVILTLGIINFNALIGTIVASYISEPAPAVIDKAFRLFQLPQGMFAVAIGTVLFPTLSRHAASGRFPQFREDLSLGLRQIFFVTLPFAAFFAVLAVPTVRLIYERGKVTPADTEQVAWALSFFSVGMAFVSANTLLNRAFYSIKKAWLPLMVGVANLVLNTVLCLLLYRPLGVGGITLATSLVSLFNFFGLAVLLRRQIGSVDERRVAWSVARSIVALVPLVAVGYGAWWLVDAWLGRSLGAQILSVGLGYAAGGGAYCLAAWAMRMEEIRDLVGIIRRRREPHATDQVFDLEGGGS